MDRLYVGLACVAAVQAASPYGDYCDAHLINRSQYEVPPGLVLKNVQFFHRHGDRSAANVLPYPHEMDTDWFECDSDETSIINTDGHYDPMWIMPKIKNASQPKHMSSTSPWHTQMWAGNCYPGRLTSKGAQQHRQLGKQLRAIYVDLLKFMPSVLDVEKTPEIIRVRSTDVRRVIESAEHNLYTFYPPDSRQSTNPIPIRVYPKQIETLVLQPDNCASLAKAFADMKASSEWYDAIPHQLMKKIRTVIGPGVEHWETWQFYDALRARHCHGKPLPCNSYGVCITEDDLGPLWKWGDVSFDYQYRKFYPEVMQNLGIGPFFSQVLNTYEEGMKNGFETRWNQYSAHDTTIGPIMGALGLETPWAPLASNVMWELWKEENENAYHVRVIVNGVRVSLPFCAGAELCPWSTFLEKLKSLVPSNLAEACALP